MPIHNKHFSVLLFWRRLVHISCADKIALEPCGAVWREAGTLNIPLSRLAKPELSCRVLAALPSSWAQSWRADHSLITPPCTHELKSKHRLPSSIALWRLSDELES
ncbi:hypothetical protein NQZ68_041570 [Dissostichus eleginoides]|nr:hypothetical protein NQZ68_041570 [Dissostichus eleginoides]